MLPVTTTIRDVGIPFCQQSSLFCQKASTTGPKVYRALGRTAKCWLWGKSPELLPGINGVVALHHFPPLDGFCIIVKDGVLQSFACWELLFKEVRCYPLVLTVIDHQPSITFVACKPPLSAIINYCSPRVARHHNRHERWLTTSFSTDVDHKPPMNTTNHNWSNDGHVTTHRCQETLEEIGPCWTSQVVNQLAVRGNHR